MRWAPATIVVGATPLVVDPGGHHRYIAARYAFVALMLVTGLAVSRRAGLPRPVLWAWAGVGAAAALATVLAPDPVYALWGDPTRMMGLATTAMVFAAFCLGRSVGRAHLLALVDAALAGGAVVAVVALLPHHGRATGTMGNAEFLGAYLCVVAPLAAARAIAEPATRRVTVPLTAVVALALYATGTRGAWIGAAVGVALVVAVALPRRRPVVLAAAGVVLLAAVVAPVGFRGEPGSGGTAHGRVDTWRLVPRVVAARPLTGWGPEGFRAGFGRAMDAHWVRTYGLRQLPDRAHNHFLDAAATTGIVGLAADAALIAAVAAALWGARRRADAAAQPLVLGIAAAGLAWLVQGQFFFDTFDVAVVLAVLLGAAIDDPAADGGGFPTSWVAGALCVPVAAIGLVNFVADRRLQTSSGRPAAQQIDRLAAVASLRPRDLDALILAGTVARASHQPALLWRAHRLLAASDDDEVRLSDARVLLALGPNAALRVAADELTALTRRRPNDPRVWQVLGDVRQAQHRPFDAARAYERAAMLTA
ncbi:MAG TPA: O-antigen ligase family protein [Acidimicrobiales bacterium]|nr:O-antigen ligase family protein [Acidimicrobiales bacterium]